MTGARNPGGDLMAARRADLGLTRAQAAARAGLSESEWMVLEHGDSWIRVWPFYTAIRVAQALDISLDLLANACLGLPAPDLNPFGRP